jgi:ketosteroid isomerase-like protein
MTIDAALLSRLDRLEAESAIRTVVARYFALCDRLDADTPMDELGELFAEEAVWAGRGARYAASFGEKRGRSAIIAMMDSYRGAVPHFAMNAHFLSSETIKVEGNAAIGGWMMLQTSTYADGTSDLRTARLTIGFSRGSDGHWQIARFETENIFSRPVDRWDDPAPVPVPK